MFVCACVLLRLCVRMQVGVSGILRVEVCEQVLGATLDQPVVVGRRLSQLRALKFDRYSYLTFVFSSACCAHPVAGSGEIFLCQMTDRQSSRKRPAHFACTICQVVSL